MFNSMLKSYVFFYIKTNLLSFKEKQYATWMAAFRLASKGRTINEPSYETECESILALLNMQLPSSNAHHAKSDIQPENYVSTKFARKYKPKQVCYFY